MIEAPHIRDKIGAHLSYPLKFGAVTSFLAPASERLPIEVWFWGYRAPRQNESRDRYRVLEIECRPQQEGASCRFTVSPVPRELRTQAHSLLVPAELERARDWLLVGRTPHWHSTYHALRLDFVPALERITGHEHNAA